MKAKDGWPDGRRKCKVRLALDGKILRYCRLQKRKADLAARDEFAWHYSGGSYAVRLDDEWEYETIS